MHPDDRRLREYQRDSRRRSLSRGPDPEPSHRPSSGYGKHSSRGDERPPRSSPWSSERGSSQPSSQSQERRRSIAERPSTGDPSDFPREQQQRAAGSAHPSQVSMPETLSTVEVGGPWRKPDPRGAATGHRQSTGQRGHNYGERDDFTREPRGSAPRRPSASGETSKVSVDSHHMVISSLLMPSRFQAENDELRTGSLGVIGDQALEIDLAEDLPGMITIKDQGNTTVHDPGLLPLRREETVSRFASRMRKRRRWRRGRSVLCNICYDV
jgi:hypothetical protein